jgi:DNA polymerase-3 subunit epsilon
MITVQPIDHTRPWWSLPIVILDFETTGVDPFECAPVSVAAAVYKEGVELRHFYSLINPGRPIPPGATEIHKVTDDMVRDAPTLPELSPQLLELAGDAAPMAYNSEYDRRIFQRYISGNECPLFDPGQRWICALVMLRKIDKYARGTGRHKLINVCKRYGEQLSEEDMHNALTDVRATGRLVAALVRSGKINPRTSLQRMLDYVDECRLFQDEDYRKYRAKKEAEAAQQQLAFNAAPNFTEAAAGTTEVPAQIEMNGDGELF